MFTYYIGKFLLAIRSSFTYTVQPATTRYLYVVCIYGAIYLQISFLKDHILLFCHEILKFFAYIWTQHRIKSILYFLVKKQHDLEENIFGFVDILHRRYKLRRDVEQTPSSQLITREPCLYHMGILLHGHLV
jgi:hypothetical protein